MGTTFRRSKFVASAAAACAVGVATKGPARAAQFEFKCGCDLPADHPVSHRLAQMWSTIDQQSGGRTHTQFFPAGQLGSASDELSQLREGALDFCWTYPAISGAMVPATDIGQLGFAYRSEEEAIRVMSNSPLADYVRKEMMAKNIVPLRGMWTTGMYDVISGPHPIRTPDDFHGFKIRVSNGSIIVDLFQALGASPVALASGEIYVALQTKLVDGTQLGLISMDTFRVWEVQKYISLTNHIWSGFWLVANGDLWKRLPPDLQQIIERNHAAQCAANQAESKALYQSIYNKMIQRGLQINPVDPAPFVRMLNPYYKKYAGIQGATEWALLESAIGRKLMA